MVTDPSGAATYSLELTNDSIGPVLRGLLVDTTADGVAPRLRGKEAREQAAIDHIMLELDGSPNKGKLGANAVLGASLAVAHAQARAQSMSLFRYLGGAAARKKRVS